MILGEAPQSQTVPTLTEGQSSDREGNPGTGALHLHGLNGNTFDSEARFVDLTELGNY
jgi:hypothetical protein